MTTLAPFTINDAHAVRKLLECFGGDRKVTWVPNGDKNYTGTNFCTGVARQLTDVNGNFIHDRDADIRDAYVWISGTFEHFILVAEVLEWIKEELFMRTPG